MRFKFKLATVILAAASNLTLIGQPFVESLGLTGSGTAVAVLDNGIDLLSTDAEKATFGCTAVAVPDTCKVIYIDPNPPWDASHAHGSEICLAPASRANASPCFRASSEMGLRSVATSTSSE